jgi:hypothetical protein
MKDKIEKADLDNKALEDIVLVIREFINEITKWLSPNTMLIDSPIMNLKTRNRKILN